MDLFPVKRRCHPSLVTVSGCKMKGVSIKVFAGFHVILVLIIKTLNDTIIMLESVIPYQCSVKVVIGSVHSDASCK